ncbi:hypothetical protein ANO14919_070650 [Xylariales sp. No.14919]|nr:hypothetical protein ANO14919_070650 [Xylariales sp. No.14919]
MATLPPAGKDMLKYMTFSDRPTLVEAEMKELSILWKVTSIDILVGYWTEVQVDNNLSQKYARHFEGTIEEDSDFESEGAMEENGAQAIGDPEKLGPPSHPPSGIRHRGIVPWPQDPLLVPSAPSAALY